MAAQFPLRVNGINIRTSEALYQACRFPHMPDVQRLIIAQKSPITAKMKSKPYRSQTREDWDNVRVRIMRWCLRVKLACNWDSFRSLLLATGDRPIVELSKKDDFWGAKMRGDDELVGANVLGRLLMELRQELRDDSAESLHLVKPPDVDQFLLYGETIRLESESRHTDMVAEDVSAGIVPNLMEASVGYSAGDQTLGNTAVGLKANATAENSDFGDIEAISAKGYPKRLIEVDLPIRRISDHARPEKTTVHGNISTLHVWWARRPYAACRAVACAALWFDPAGKDCPTKFRSTARQLMEKWAKDHVKLSEGEAGERFLAIRKEPSRLDDNFVLRQALLDFIADFSQWRHQSTSAFLEVAQTLTTSAHEATDAGNTGDNPLVFDPFAGGGTIPLECMRIGASAFASDLNPLAVLMNTVVVELIPRWGTRLSHRVSELGQKIKLEASKELDAFYPRQKDGAVPIAYLWSRVIHCEGPGCGYKVPLVRTLDLGRGQHLKLKANESKSSFDVSVVRTSTGAPTVQSGSVACPRPNCGYTTPAKAVRAQLSARSGGSKDAQLLAVFVEKGSRREFRAGDCVESDTAIGVEALNVADLPDTIINPIRPHKNTRGLSAVTRIGMTRFTDLYTDRQLRGIWVFSRILAEMMNGCREDALDRAALTVLGLCFGRLLHQNSTCSRWLNKRNTIAGSFGKQALQVTWDFAEVVPIGESTGSWASAIDWALKVINLNATIQGNVGTVVHAAAQECPLPKDSASLLLTDPPYFAAIPYADLSNFFYVWQRRIFASLYPNLFSRQSVDQSEEVIVTDANSGPGGIKKDEQFFKAQMTLALRRAREIVIPSGLGVIVFADSRTESWEALLGAVIESGWTITASWPIDTENRNRPQARGAASLQSSIHLVCRPRENPDGSLQDDAVGDWRGVLNELPKRIHAWMPRLANEGVVGADAIFACLGPALEVFSRYSRVEKVSGEQVKLREYLEQVWAAVAREALSMIFEDADATGLEEDSRLTAMWLWTLSTSSSNVETSKEGSSASKPKISTGFSLEFDAARKIAQGLGVHLQDLDRVVEIKGDQARLLPVSERTQHLFGKDHIGNAPVRRPKRSKQLSLFDELEDIEIESEWGEISPPPPGNTTLDRIHQAMVLFAAGRGEALKRFLVEESVGSATAFWKLAQSLSALYPSGTDEKRWVDGVLARKKGLGF